MARANLASRLAGVEQAIYGAIPERITQFRTVAAAVLGQAAADELCVLLDTAPQSERASALWEQLHADSEGARVAHATMRLIETRIVIRTITDAPRIPMENG